MAAFTILKCYKNLLFPFNVTVFCFLFLFLIIPDSCQFPLLDPEDTRTRSVGEFYEWLKKAMHEQVDSAAFQDFSKITSLEDTLLNDLTQPQGEEANDVKISDLGMMEDVRSQNSSLTALTSTGTTILKSADQRLVSLGTTTTTNTDDWWTLCQLPVFIVLFAVVGVLAVTIVVLLWLKSQMLESEKDISSRKSVNGGGQKLVCPTHASCTDDRWIFHTVINLKCTPTEEKATTTIPVQPQEDSGGVEPVEIEKKTPSHGNTFESTDGGVGIGMAGRPSASPSPTPTPEKRPEALRIRAKGLLERRGSNVSLTIDLPQANSDQPAHIITPTRECSAEEFLLSAGNSLCRSQLRTCLRDTGSLHREFWEIPLNHPEEVQVVGWSSKNRYRSILPNERSRVLLSHLEDPYINANYVRGYDGEEKVYIATQGPLGNTVSDLYHMVWTHRCPIIVMMTHLVEKAKPKCEPYFPLGLQESATYGDFTVTVAELIHRQGYVLRHLLVQYKGEARTILHYWYDTWPDHKTPHNTNSILAMATEIEKQRTSLKNITSNNNESVETSNSGPVVVHCSAGIGRTGCFIAISLAICQLLEENKVDLLGIVCQMRYDRGGMVQTAEQYEFIHRAIAMFEASLPDTD